MEVTRNLLDDAMELSIACRRGVIIEEKMGEILERSPEKRMERMWSYLAILDPIISNLAP